MSKKQRIEIQRETIKYVERNRRKYNSKITKYVNNEPLYDKRWLKIDNKTSIEVLPLDTLEAVMKLKAENTRNKTGFLVMANATNKGGGYIRGTTGQEESICRRTNLVECFKFMKDPTFVRSCFFEAF